MMLVSNAVPWYLTPNFLPAAFGLLGVVVGGLITAVSSYLLDEKRGEREREREERNRSIEIKRAARMIDADFSLAEAYANVALEGNRYWSSTDAHLEFEGWDDYAAILAPAVSSDVWFKIRAGTEGVKTLNDFREMDASHTVGTVPLSTNIERSQTGDSNGDG